MLFLTLCLMFHVRIWVIVLTGWSEDPKDKNTTAIPVHTKVELLKRLTICLPVYG
jgi:hypothetical protein